MKVTDILNSQSNPKYAGMSNDELVALTRSTNVAKDAAYAAMDSATTPEAMDAADAAMDDIQRTLHELDDELCNRNLDFPKD